MSYRRPSLDHESQHHPRSVSAHALLAIVLTAALLAAACARTPSAPAGALDAVSGDRLMQHIRILSSDEFEGRAPGGKGEELTVRYLIEQFRTAGLEPGHPGGGFIQKVPLVGITADPNRTLTITGRGPALRLRPGTDFVAVTRRVTESVALDAEMIFAGYGIQAPEFAWDDFKDADVRGKVLVVLINDPPLEDQTQFGGPAMTYYGRWTYKFEKAAEMGAAGCFIIHETGPAGYGWGVVQSGWSGEQFDLVTPDRNMGRAAVEGWLSNEQAAALLRRAGHSYDALKQAALSRDFRPVPLGMKAQITLKNTLRTIDSQNVIARLTGSDDRLKNEYVVYTAHWDHLGRDGDLIYNGALDNASGTAALLEIARAFKQLRTPPKRTLLFLAVTAEEQGLLGSRYYAEHPLYPLERTAAVINMDGVNTWGPTRDIVMVGKGSSTLDEIVEAAARERNRTVKPDPEPEKGFFYRSDHFNFAKMGVPAFYPNRGIEYLGKPAGWGMEMRARYTAEDYHKPSDVIKDWWDIQGTVEDARLFILVGYRIANDARKPEWKPGSEFKAIREESLRKAAGNP